MELHDVKALELVLKALEGLEPALQERVLRWASEKLELKPSGRPSVAAGASTSPQHGSGELERYETLADAWADAQPETDAERALLVAAFLSRKDAKATLTGQEINAELKDLGHGIGSINKAIDALMERKPQLMVQTKKSGSHQQARKNYKVTAAGFAAAAKFFRVGAEGASSP